MFEFEFEFDILLLPWCSSSTSSFSTRFSSSSSSSLPGELVSEVPRSRGVPVGLAEWQQCENVMTALEQSGSAKNLHYLRLDVRDDLLNANRIGKLLLEVLPRTVPNLVRLAVSSRFSTAVDLVGQLARRLDGKDYHSDFKTTTALNLRHCRFFFARSNPPIEFANTQCVGCGAPIYMCTTTTCELEKASLVTILSQFKNLSDFVTHVYPVDLRANVNDSNKAKELNDKIKHLLFMNRSGIRKITPGEPVEAVKNDSTTRKSIDFPVGLWPHILEKSWRPVSKTKFDDGRVGFVKENVCRKCYSTPEWPPKLNASALYSVLRPSPESKDVPLCLLPRCGLEATMPDAPPPRKKKKPREESIGMKMNSHNIKRAKKEEIEDDDDDGTGKK